MNTTEYIKTKIKEMYESGEEVHISINMTHPKLVVNDSTAIVKGVYNSIFQIEENDSGIPHRHTFQYNDVLIGHVIIKELNYAPVFSKP